jgi:hypothetical protein
MSEEVEVISWNDALETLVAEESERCGGLAWLHAETEKYFALRTNWVAIPVIILSTANGFLSGSSSSIFSNPTTASIGLGMVSLFTGVLSTIGSYFAWAKRTEAHRISAIQYKILSRSLAIELSLPKSERVGAKDILKVTKEQIERLIEISPAIPPAILKMYKEAFPDMTQVAHPEIIAGVKKVIVNKWMPEDTEDAIQVKVLPKFNQAFSGPASAITGMQGPASSALGMQGSRSVRSVTPGRRQ